MIKLQSSMSKHIPVSICVVKCNMYFGMKFLRNLVIVRHRVG